MNLAYFYPLPSKLPEVDGMGLTMVASAVVFLLTIIYVMPRLHTAPREQRAVLMTYAIVAWSIMTFMLIAYYQRVTS